MCKDACVPWYAYSPVLPLLHYTVRWCDRFSIIPRLADPRLRTETCITCGHVRVLCAFLEMSCVCDSLRQRRCSVRLCVCASFSLFVLVCVCVCVCVCACVRLTGDRELIRHTSGCHIYLNCTALNTSEGNKASVAIRSQEGHSACTQNCVWLCVRVCVCVCMCLCACVLACMCVCVRVCVACAQGHILRKLGLGVRGET